MQPDDVTEPLDVQELRQKLDEWAAISSHMIDLLRDSREGERATNWRPHCEQIIQAVGRFGDRCRAEARAMRGSRMVWREPDDAFEAVRSEGQRLVSWLQRMIAE